LLFLAKPRKVAPSSNANRATFTEYYSIFNNKTVYKVMKMSIFCVVGEPL